MASESQKQELVSQLMRDIGGEIVVDDSNKIEWTETINDILRDYNLSTDLAFVEKIAKMKFPKNGESVDMSSFGTNVIYVFAMYEQNDNTTITIDVGKECLEVDSAPQNKHFW